MTVSWIFLIEWNIAKNLPTIVFDNTTNDVDVSFKCSICLKWPSDIYRHRFQGILSISKKPGDKDIGFKVLC